MVVDCHPLILKPPYENAIILASSGLVTQMTLGLIRLLVDYQSPGAELLTSHTRLYHAHGMQVYYQDHQQPFASSKWTIILTYMFKCL